MTYAQAPDSCDECAEPVADDDLAPSCGAHRLHVTCAPFFVGCKDCDDARREFRELATDRMFRTGEWSPEGDPLFNEAAPPPRESYALPGYCSTCNAYRCEHRRDVS